MIGNGYDSNEPVEVKVKEAGNLDELMSHVKVVRNGSTSYYDYHDNRYIKADAIVISSGESVTDFIEHPGYRCTSLLPRVRYYTVLT